MKEITVYLHQDLTERIIRSFYTVYNELGYGFLEKVYQNGLYIQLKSNGFKVEAQKPIKVVYREVVLGEYFADLIINDVIILELKAHDFLREEHEYQLLNYLKATDAEVGLLLNFGKRPEVRRKIFTNDLKGR